MAPERKPWEIPISYTDSSTPDRDDERSAEDIEELVRRPARSLPQPPSGSTDTAPIDYGRGPHESAYSLDDE